MLFGKQKFWKGGIRMSFLSKIFNGNSEQVTAKTSVQTTTSNEIDWGCPACVAEQGQARGWNGMVASEYGDIDALCPRHKASMYKRIDDVKTGKVTLADMSEDGKKFFCRDQRVACNFLILAALYRGASNDEQKIYWRDVLARWHEGAVTYCNQYGKLCSDGKRKEQTESLYRQEHQDDSLF